MGLKRGAFSITTAQSTAAAQCTLPERLSFYSSAVSTGSSSNGSRNGNPCAATDPLILAVLLKASKSAVLDLERGVRSERYESARIISVRVAEGPGGIALDPYVWKAYLNNGTSDLAVVTGHADADGNACDFGTAAHTLAPAAPTGPPRARICPETAH